MAKKRKKAAPARKGGATATRAQGEAAGPSGTDAAGDKLTADQGSSTLTPDDKHTSTDRTSDAKRTSDANRTSDAKRTSDANRSSDAKRMSDPKRTSGPRQTSDASRTSDDKPKSRGALRRQAARVERAAEPAATLGPAPEPTFWFGFDVTWAKLVLARVVIFAILAVDAIEQIKHAPRYGAGGFNVAHLPLFDALGPTRATYSICQLVLSFCFVLAACGVATRVVLPAATVIYGWLYFGSQLDSYQHHYLVWLLLLVACFVPWSRPLGAVPATRVRTWAIRLLLIQLAILYFWAAVSKMNGAWLDGRTLSGQIGGGVRSLIDSTIGIKGASWMVMLSELVLAATIWSRRGWWVAAPLGLGLHIGIMFTSLEIGRFAELMLALYVLVVPDRVWTSLAALPPFSIVRRFSNVMRTQFDGVAGWILLAGALGAGIVLAVLSRFDHGLAVGLTLLAITAVGSVVWRRRVSIEGLALSCMLAFGTWTAVDRFTKTASDYFRLWGGSSRRLGDPKTSEYAYRRMTEIAPEEAGGHYQLGKLLLQRGADDEGLAAIRKAQRLEPLKARAHIVEARYLAQKGRVDEAVVKAREATILEPDNAEAQNLLNSLLAK